MSSGAVFNPTQGPQKTALSRAINAVGVMIQAELVKPLDLMRITQEGLEPDLIETLIEKGFSRKDIAWIVPPRTLRHRREKHERLTPEESDRLLRAAKLYALAVEVQGSEEKALRWLVKPRKAFDGYSAMELMRSETGAEVVEERLCQMDSGYFA